MKEPLRIPDLQRCAPNGHSSAALAMTRCSGEIASLGEGVKVEVIAPGLPVFHVVGYAQIGEAYVFESPDDHVWRSLFPLPGIGHRLPLHVAGDEELAPLPDIIARRFPSLCGGRRLP